MGKGLLVVSIAAAGTGAAGIVVFAILMMGTGMGSMMNGGHMTMMGGGSNPADEAAVEGVTEVRVENIAFAPANIVVDVGTAVTWVNGDDIAHTVTSDGRKDMNSPLFGRGGTFSHTFDEPGEYAYHCTPHPNMQGLVTVREAGAG